MGILTVAKPIDWTDALQYMEYVREHGVDQFIVQFRAQEYIAGDKLMYGDEVEYGIFKLDAAAREAKLALRGAEVLEFLRAKEGLRHTLKLKFDDSLKTIETRALSIDLAGKEFKVTSAVAGSVIEPEAESTECGQCSWVPEYGSWMIESTPAEPYGGFTSDLRRVEGNMRARRARLLHALKENEIAPTIVVFPRLGCGDFTGSGAPKQGPVANSRFVPDEVINPHPRFGALTRNIRKRRGRNVKVMSPLFKDVHTDMTPEEGAEGTPGIYMDAMAFGMGCCCLQVTFQARDMHESRHLYDQLAVMAPIMLALTAATPIVKGKLSDWDARWNYIAASVDCRTPAESGESCSCEVTYDSRMAGGGKRRLNKSRYSGIDMYLCNHLNGADEASRTSLYNDVEIQYDEAAYTKLRDAGIDETLAKHVSHLFVRDPLVIFEGRVNEIDDRTATDHFENLQSTNWNSVRWKPPPPQAPEQRKIGWRTEFRTMEIQLTDFENAAYTVFITLVSRVLLSFDLNLYIPISKNDENMDRAHQRNAATAGKFWFRSHLAETRHSECKSSASGGCCSIHSNLDHLQEMTCLEILTGKGNYFPGFVPLIMVYMATVGFDAETVDKVQAYLDLIVKRASGEIMTPATWMRNFVTEHPDYKQDSVVSERISYDLVRACNDIGLGRRPAPKLLGDVRITPVVESNAYNVQLSHLKLPGEQIEVILQRYKMRAERLAQRKRLLGQIDAKKAELAALEAELDGLQNEMSPEFHERVRLDSLSVPDGRKSPEAD